MSKIVPDEFRRDSWENLGPECVEYMIEENIVNARTLTDFMHHHVVQWWDGKLSSVLDAPVDSGYYPVLIGQGFRTYRGIDISPEMIRKAKELHPEVKRKIKVGMEDTERVA